MELGFRPGKIAGPAPEEPKLAKLSKMLQQVAVTIEEIAEKQYEEWQAAAAAAAGITEVGGGAEDAKEDLAEDAMDESASVWTREAVLHLFTMLTSESEDVRKRGAIALAKLASCSPKAKLEATDVPEIFETLLGMVRNGGLEGIDAIAALTCNNPVACNKVRDVGAITVLAGFINTEDATEDVKASSAVLAERMTPSAPGTRPAQQADRRGAPKKVGTLADLGDSLLPGMTAGREFADPESVNRPAIVPVASKAEAVSALRNIATSNDENREAITRQQVIPQLVKLMTQMKGNDDDNRSTQSSQHSVDSHGRKKEKKRTTNVDGSAVLDRKQLAEDNRKLAESAGRMLHTLIMEGSESVKKVIINAIIATVQQPGSKPPRDVPALMTILRSAAQEQLDMVQRGDDYGALNMALEFGRWIGIRTIKLGEARNAFKMRQEEKRKEEQARERHLALGFTDGGPNLDDASVLDADDVADNEATALDDTEKYVPKGPAPKHGKKMSSAVAAEQMALQQKRRARKEAAAKQRVAKALREKEAAAAASLAALTCSGPHTRYNHIHRVTRQMVAQEREALRLMDASAPDADMPWHLAFLGDREPLSDDLWTEHVSVLPEHFRTAPVDAISRFQSQQAFSSRQRHRQEQQLAAVSTHLDVLSESASVHSAASTRAPGSASPAAEESVPRLREKHSTASASC